MLTRGFLTNPEHCRERAEDMRLTASSVKDADARSRMLRIAEGFEKLRRQTEQRVTSLFALAGALSSALNGLTRLGSRPRRNIIQ